MSETSDPRPAEWGLIMPFTVCRSHNGPYDDQAFVAGVRYGMIWAEARDLLPGHASSWTVEPALLPQLDLLAMHEGLDFKSEPWDEQWATVTLTRGIGRTTDESERGV